MSWLGLVVLILCLYLAFKVAGVVLKLVLWLLIVVAAYWFVAPFFGWPPPMEVVRVLS